MSHVADLQNLIGSGHVARPALDLSAAGAVTSANIITIARQFEDIGTTAYAGATSLLAGTNLMYAAQILAVEGFQAGALRLINSAVSTLRRRRLTRRPDGRSRCCGAGNAGNCC